VLSTLPSAQAFRLSLSFARDCGEFGSQQIIHDLTISNVPIAAAFDHASKLPSQQGKLSDLFLDQPELTLSERGCFEARRSWRLLEGQKRADCFEIEADIASVADESEALCVGLAIPPPSVPAAICARRQAYALIIPNRFNVDA
jgi:hypothetical protein